MTQVVNVNEINMFLCTLYSGLWDILPTEKESWAKISPFFAFGDEW